MGPTGAPLVARQLMRLTLSAAWVLMVAFDGPLPNVGFEGGWDGPRLMANTGFEDEGVSDAGP